MNLKRPGKGDNDDSDTSVRTTLEEHDRTEFSYDTTLKVMIIKYIIIFISYKIWLKSKL